MMAHRIGESAESSIDEATITCVQEILDHMIMKNKPRGTKTRAYAKFVRKHLMFFNELREEILIKNKTHQNFKIGQALLQELKWVFSDEMAHLLHDALCSTEEAFKVTLKNKESTERKAGDNNEEFTTEKTSTYFSKIPAEDTEVPMSTSFDGDETQFQEAEIMEETVEPNENQMIDDSVLIPSEIIQSPLDKRRAKNDFPMVQPCVLGFKNNQIPSEIHCFKALTQQRADERTNDSNFQCENKLKNPNCEMSEKKIHKVQMHALADEIEIHTEIMPHERFDGQQLDLRLGKPELEPPKLWDSDVTVHRNRAPEVTQTACYLENPSQIGLDAEVLDFYPQDISEEKNSQLDLVVREQSDRFLDTLTWDSMQSIKRKPPDEQTVFFRKFYHLASQFTCTLNSKMSLTDLNYFDQFVSRMKSINIHDNTQNNSPFDVFGQCSSSSFRPDSNADQGKEQATDREELLTNLLQKIFGCLEEILKDFSKLHSTIFNWEDFLVKQVFKDVNRYFNERFTADVGLSNANTSLNICCNFIKNAINRILNSDELCQFLKWEEQCFLLGELCNNKAVCRNTLEFLFDRMVNLLEKPVEQNQTPSECRFENPDMFEKLVIIFPMMQDLLHKYVNLASAETTETAGNEKKEENVTQLCQSDIFFTDKNFDFEILQDFEESSNSEEQRWMEKSEKIIKLTVGRFNVLSTVAQRILCILKETEEGGKLNYFYSQSEKSYFNGQ